jgi:hypothetical protein
MGAQPRTSAVRTGFQLVHALAWGAHYVVPWACKNKKWGRIAQKTSIDTGNKGGTHPANG